jgi:4-methyl-5(b-hydroxyethyl)-thiazole monophosphate biosynthesis
MADVLVPIADGTEEIEAVTVIDTLRRAETTVVVAAIGAGRRVVCSRGVTIEADVLLADLPDDATFDAIVLPGGMPGAEHLRDNPRLLDRLRGHDAANQLLAAICAAPAVVLEHHGLVRGRAVTCHPGFFDQLPPATRRTDRVVLDQGLLTSRGPGTALEFALAIVEQLHGADARQRVAEPMLPPAMPATG